jgi:hypothetical protein
MKQYYGNYVGIVVQNNDPEKAGKLKVFVPHITATVYKKWVEEKTNKQFNFLGANIQSALTQSLTGTGNGKIEQVNTIIEELKLILPWAECAAPLIGENSSGRFNSYNNFSNISDSNFYSTFSQSTSSGSDTPGKPGSIFENPNYRLTDAFVNAGDNINRPNPLAYEYVPSTYSNRAKGSFSIPAVGSHVWVFFREGNPQMPVYFASVFGREDWTGIYESYDGGSIDYPGTFENKNTSQTDYNVNVETYRNKYVLNQKGGTIEVTNTDLKENLKFTHYSGSFKEFNNQANIELATKNDQKLVLNDQYETVRGFKNEYVGKNLDENIIRDKYKKVGTLNADYFQQWKDIIAPIQDNKMLFEIQRAVVDNVLDNLGNIALQRTSNMQTRVGTFAPHPALNGTKTYPTVNDTSTLVSEQIRVSGLTISSSFGDQPTKLDIPQLPAIEKPVFLPGAGVDILRYTKDTNMIWGPGGVGFSTSSQDGIWAPDARKELFGTLLQASIARLTEIENELGIGGSEIIQITKHKVETIGMEINNFGSFRFDKIGKMLDSEVLVDQAGTFVNYKESPLVEYVHVQDLPGGDYTLNVCNRFNVMVGAGGLNLKSLGSTNITGTITNIVGEQLNIASQNEINIDAGTLNISAEILRLRNKRGKQIYIDDNLGVNKNVIIGGGLSVDGEMFVQHITAPVEYQVTEATQLFGKLLAGLTFEANIATAAGTTKATITLLGNSNENLVQCYEHSHVFKNIPLTLHDQNSKVRDEASAMNKGNKRVPATRRYHKKK